MRELTQLGVRNAETKVVAGRSGYDFNDYDPIDATRAYYTFGEKEVG